MGAVAGHFAKSIWRSSLDWSWSWNNVAQSKNRADFSRPGNLHVLLWTPSLFTVQTKGQHHCLAFRVRRDSKRLLHLRRICQCDRTAQCSLFPVVRKPWKPPTSLLQHQTGWVCWTTCGHCRPLHYLLCRYYSKKQYLVRTFQMHKHICTENGLPTTAIDEEQRGQK